MDEQLELLVVPGDRLTPGQRRDLLAVCSRAFKMDYDPVYAAFPDPTHVLAYAGSALVSHALWITRWLQTSTSPLLRAAFVEAVATDPPCQGRGYATQVMRRLQAAVACYDLAALSTGKPGFYGRLGWELWHGPLFIRTNGDLLATPDDSVMVLHLPKTPPLDLHGSLSAEWRAGELW